jgi:hypothetical protein
MKEFLTLPLHMKSVIIGFMASSGQMKDSIHGWMKALTRFMITAFDKWKYVNEGEIRFGTQSFAIRDAERLLFESKAAVKKDQPINTEGEKFTKLNYASIAYYKTGAWLELVEKKLGKQTFDKAMQEYYRQWQFKHPYPEDFKKVLESVSGQNLDAEFALLDKKGVLPGMERKGTKIIFPYSAKAMTSYIKDPSKNAIIISPIAGVNAYDKFMIRRYYRKLQVTSFPPSSFL